MERARLSRLAHADHPVAAPLDDAAVARMLSMAVPTGARVLDLGCGDGTWLLRALRQDPTVRAVGVDLSDEGFADVRAEAAAEGLADRLELVQADATTWAADEPFDVVLCVGSTHAFGGLVPTLDAVAGYLRPGGRAVVGEGFWERPPGQATLDALQADAGEYPDLAGTLALTAEHGWLALHGHVSSLREWDDYEWAWTGALTRWALAHPDDPDREQVLQVADEHRRQWLEGYRGTLGFVTLVLARP